jgi:hypothetical protein
MKNKVLFFIVACCFAFGVKAAGPKGSLSETICGCRSAIKTVITELPLNRKGRFSWPERKYVRSFWALTRKHADKVKLTDLRRILSGLNGQ